MTAAYRHLDGVIIPTGSWTDIDLLGGRGVGEVTEIVTNWLQGVVPSKFAEQCSRTEPESVVRFCAAMSIACNTTEPCLVLSDRIISPFLPFRELHSCLQAVQRQWAGRFVWYMCIEVQGSCTHDEIRRALRGLSRVQYVGNACFRWHAQRITDSRNVPTSSLDARACAHTSHQERQRRRQQRPQRPQRLRLQQQQQRSNREARNE